MSSYLYVEYEHAYINKGLVSYTIIDHPETATVTGPYYVVIHMYNTDRGEFTYAIEDDLALAQKKLDELNGLLTI